MAPGAQPGATKGTEQPHYNMLVVAVTADGNDRQCQRKGVGALGENGEGTRKHRLVKHSHGDVKHSIRYTVNNMVIPVRCQVGAGNIRGSTL